MCALVTLLAFAGCASARKQTTPPPTNEVAGPPESLKNSATPGEVYGPFPTNTTPDGPAVEPAANPDRVVLVFGRGLTRGYAYVGVLRALHDLKVPVGAVYATEVGALAAALYYTQPNPNRIDWALLRFTEKNLGPTTGKFSLSLKSPEEELDARLKEVFGERRVETTADRLRIELQDAKSGEPVEARSGELWRAIRGALAGGNGFGPADLEGREVKVSARRIGDEFRVAQQAERYPIIVVSVGDAPSESLRKLVADGKATLIHVPLAGIDDLDLKQRNRAVFAGKSAVNKAAPEILALIGKAPERKAE
ncbi:MAG: hypothetical protein JST04_14395 [Bdellovibrionales bacterium]|nr:hypothetical protein [Bdellovibrionales bacterium]